MKEPLTLAVGTGVRLVPSTASSRNRRPDDLFVVTGTMFDGGNLLYSLDIGSWYERIDLVFVHAATPASMVAAATARDFDELDAPNPAELMTFYSELEAKMSESIAIRDTDAMLTHKANSSADVD